MNAQQLIDTATMMVAGDKGLLAMDLALLPRGQPPSGISGAP